MADLFGYLWSALIVGGWVYLTVEFIRAAIHGRFWFWRRKANGNTWPPIRAENPVRFWVSWALMAGPFLFLTALTALVLVGIA